MKDLFHSIHPKRIISFVHAIGLALRHDIAATCVLKMPLNPNHPSIHPSVLHYGMSGAPTAVNSVCLCRRCCNVFSVDDYVYNW